MLRILCFFVIIYWCGRNVGDSINIENRDIGGKPVFVVIPTKWRWLFPKPKNWGGMFHKQITVMYSMESKMVRAAVASYLLSYLFSLLEMLLFGVSIFWRTKPDLAIIAYHLLLIYVFLEAFCILLPNGVRYEWHIRKTYDYDLITFYKEQLTGGRTKRSCTIVSHIEDNIYEITLGRFGKKRFRAKAEMPVTIGTKKYAVHIEHPLDENKPYWSIKNH